MSRRDLRMLLFLAAVAALWMLTQGIAGLDSAWLTMAPALLIVVPLVGGRYVGADALRRRTRCAPRRPRGPVALVARPRPPRAMRRGGLLVARRLAGRAPPHIALAG
jgi:hypothetical protein